MIWRSGYSGVFGKPACDILRDNFMGGRGTPLVTLTNSMPGVSFSLNGATTDPYGNAVTGATPTGALGFDARGIPLTAGTYFIASSDSKNSYAVTVTGAGRVRIWSKVAGAWR